MKAIFIILSLITIGYTYCLMDVIDINLSTEFSLNSKFTLPNNTVLYFRLLLIDTYEKVIQLRAEKNDSFIIKYGSSEEKPDIEDIEEWNELEYKKLVYDSQNYIHYYNLIPKENIKYFLISVTLKNDLKYFSIYIENDKSETDEIITYKAKYFTEYQVNLTKSQLSKFIIELDEIYQGESFLNFIVNHNDIPVDFRIFAFGVETNINNYISIELQDVTEPGNEIYKYSFNLDKKIKNVKISVEMNKKIDFSFYLNFTKNDNNDKLVNIYNIDYDKFYNMKGAIYGLDKSRYITLKTTSKYIGDVYIILKVDNNALDDNFELEVYGTEKPGQRNKTYLNVEYNNIYNEGNYNIIQYYFKSDKKTAFFTININVPKYTGYLSIKIDKGNNEKKTSILFIVLIVIAAIVFYIIYIQVVIYYICSKGYSFKIAMFLILLPPTLYLLYKIFLFETN